MSKTVKFNAGKVHFNDETKRCTPKPHKGTVTIKRSTEDEDFFDFIWAPLGAISDDVEKDELLVIPGDVSFKPIGSCDSGRVVSLRFLSSGARYLYWLQDVGDDDDLSKFTEVDQKIVAEVNGILAPIDELDDELSETQHAKEESTEQPSVLQQNPLANIAIDSLADLLDMEVIERHFDTLTASEIKEQYSHLLPPSIGPNPSKTDLIELIHSPFFRSAVSNLAQLLNRGANLPLSQAFKFEYHGEGAEAFLRGLREAGESSKKESKEGKK